MLTCYDSQNHPVKLLKELGRGGEGAVYACEDEKLVGKIYHAPISAEKAEKLLWMAENSTPQLLKTTAWITEILKDKPDGNVVGFLMPKIKAKEIHELYAPKSRRVHFPDATWHFLIHTATNLARAFHNLHKDGHVMGDVNQGNCVVTIDGTVKLIDCDSYGITTSDKNYECKVGVTTHIPPELQGKNLRHIDRTENHDNFGLAIIIFQLLFLGRHPFSGNYPGAEDKTLEDAIREYLFVYGQDAEKKRLVRPPGTLPMSAVSPPIAALFERAFSEEKNRPKPNEWVQSLEYLGNNLQQCLLNPGHIYYSKISFCPWCEIEGNTGLMLFPFNVSTNALSKKYERDFDVSIVKKLIESFNISSLPAKLADSFPATRVTPSREIIKERRKLNRMLKISIGITPPLLLISWFLSVPFLMYWGCIFLINKFVIEDSAGKEIRKKEREKLAELQLQYDYLESVFEKTAKTFGLSKQLLQIQQALSGYDDLKTSFKGSVKIEDEDSFVTEVYETQVRQAESSISALLISIRAGSVEVRRQQQKIIAQGRNSLQDFLQARTNVAHLGFEEIPKYILFGSVAIFAFLPSFSYFQKQKNPESITLASKTTSQMTASISPIEIPSQSITDNEIAKLSANIRRRIFDELINRAENSMASENNQQAESVLVFARRFDKNNIEAVNLLGIVSYNLDKFNQALEYFDLVEKIEPGKVEEFYLGMTYLQLKKYKEARHIFSKINNNQFSSQSLYNLGSANIGLKDYKAAAKNYNAILNISPGDTDAMYQLGICYAKLGDAAGVLQTYQTLKSFDSNRADEMRKIAAKSVNLNIITTALPSPATGNGSGIGTSGDESPPPPPPPPVGR